MILGDFHIHSSFSDGVMTIPELVDFYGKRGFGAIAITDHLCERESFLGKAAQYLERTLLYGNFAEYLEIIYQEAKRAKEKYGMAVIPGVEVTKNSFVHANSAHILGLGITDYIDPDQDIPSICRQIRSQGALSVAAHPVSTKKLEPQTFYLWDNRERLSDFFDAWEVASGPEIFTEVLSSDLPKLASSDLHRPHQIKSWKTLVYSDPEPVEVLRAIKEQRIDFDFYTEVAHEHQEAIAAF